MQCVSRCPLPKKAAQHTVLFACDGVHQCLMLYDVWRVRACVLLCVVVWWCGGCKGKKGKEAKTQSNKNKKDFSQNHSFPFPFFPLLFLPLFSPCLPLFHHYPLLILTFKCFPCFKHGRIHGEPKTPMTQHLFHFIFFSFCPNSLFLFFSFCRLFNDDVTTTQYHQTIK